MKKSIQLIGTMLIGSIILSSCGGEIRNRQKSTEVVISDSLFTGKEYFQTTLDYFFGQSWLTFDGATVEFTVRSKDGWGNTIDNKEVIGKYRVTKNKESHTIECGFGRESINIEYLTGGFNPERKDVDYPLPQFLKVELDSLNNLLIKNWEIIESNVEE